jgi:hypothetical protein
MTGKDREIMFIKQRILSALIASAALVTLIKRRRASTESDYVFTIA